MKLDSEKRFTFNLPSSPHLGLVVSKINLCAEFQVVNEDMSPLS